MKKLIFLFLFAGPAYAGDWWTDSKLTNGLMISVNVLLIADWAQTRYIADNLKCDNPQIYAGVITAGDALPIFPPQCERFHENGLAQHFIGDRPTTGDVNRYFLSSLVLMNSIGYFLPDKYKNVFYFGVASFEANVVYQNADIGIKLEF